MGARVLLIDDEPDLLLALAVRLGATGFECETATDGREGLEKCMRWHPDVVVTDLLMPQMNGYELCRQLKAQPGTATIPVVVLTALRERSLDNRLGALGAARMLRKPFDAQELITTIHDVLGSRTT